MKGKKRRKKKSVNQESHDSRLDISATAWFFMKNVNLQLFRLWASWAQMCKLRYLTSISVACCLYQCNGPCWKPQGHIICSGSASLKTSKYPSSEDIQVKLGCLAKSMKDTMFVYRVEWTDRTSPLNLCLRFLSESVPLLARLVLHRLHAHIHVMKSHIHKSTFTATSISAVASLDCISHSGHLSCLLNKSYKEKKQLHNN